MSTRLRGLAVASAFTTAATAGLLAPAAHAAEATTGDRVVSAAAAEAGKPYAAGGTGPDSFDCSGLAQYAYRQAGISLPRTASQQRSAARGVAQSDARPGDLIFFSNGGRVYHVGIFMRRQPDVGGPAVRGRGPAADDLDHLLHRRPRLVTPRRAFPHPGEARR